MMYILTQEEFNALTAKKDSVKLENTKKLQQLCTKIANEMPISRSWNPKDEPKPWGCILNVKSGRHMKESYEPKEGRNPGYCDECPVETICPYPYKEHSQ